MYLVQCETSAFCFFNGRWIGTFAIKCREVKQFSWWLMVVKFLSWICQTDYYWWPNILFMQLFPGALANAVYCQHSALYGSIHTQKYPTSYLVLASSYLVLASDWKCLFYLSCHTGTEQGGGHSIGLILGIVALAIVLGKTSMFGVYMWRRRQKSWHRCSTIQRGPPSDGGFPSLNREDVEICQYSDGGDWMLGAGSYGQVCPLDFETLFHSCVQRKHSFISMSAASPASLLVVHSLSLFG